MFTFDFSQGKISRLHKKLSQLNGDNPKQYPEYKKYMMELINLEDNNNIYVNKLSALKSFYILHLAKLFFYWDYTDSDKLHNADWTKNHWIEEIISIFRFTDRYDANNPEKELRLHISKLEGNSKKSLQNILNSSLDLRLNNNIITKLTKGDPDDIHELPPLDPKEVSLKWDAFKVFCTSFTNKVLERVGYSVNTLLDSSIIDFINKAKSRNYLSILELNQDTKDIKFSELAAEDIIEMFRNY